MSTSTSETGRISRAIRVIFGLMDSIMTCAARLKVADVIETDIVGKQKADEKQCRVRQHIQKAFEALVLFQQEVMPSLR